MRTELAIIGAGPAGMAGAEAAADCGVEITVIDEQPAAGGQIYRQPPHEFTVTNWLEGRVYAAGKSLLRRVSDNARIRWLTESKVSGIVSATEAGGDGRFTLVIDGPDGVRGLAAESVLIAPGCYDMPVLFPGWNLPGVMAAGGIQTFVKSQRFVPGGRFLFAGSHPLQLVVADQVVQAGGEVAGVLFAQSRRRALRLLKFPAVVWRGRAKLLQTAAILRRLRRAGVPVRFAQALLRANGGDRLESVKVAPAGPDGVGNAAAAREIACDRLGVCFGFLASSELAQQAGAATRWDAPRGGWVVTHDAWMRTRVPGVAVAGEITGVAGAEVAAEEGRLAAIGCALDLGKIDDRRANDLAVAPRRALATLNRFARLLSELSWPGDRCLDQWLSDNDINLCKCEEVTVGDFVEQLRRNPDITSASAAKLLTRAGMGPCQGRYCQFAVTRVVACLSGEPEDRVGAFSARFPSRPVEISALVDSDL
jgi:NADPH-dependent 2,4-dienoyl-CoA reductase/sulfur reductase-like enzyme